MEAADEKKLAATCFNGTWDLIDKQDRTKEDDFRMIHMAHASCFHWSNVGTPKNVARGEWQISHVYALLSHGPEALFHAERCLQITAENDLGDFDMAFANEGIARAYAVLGNAEKTEAHRAAGLEYAAKVADDGEKKYTIGELENIRLSER